MLPNTTKIARPFRCMLTAVVVLLGLGLQESSASSISSNSTFRIDEHHLYCKCASKCKGASCCCGPRESRPKEHSARDSSQPLKNAESDGPCVGSAPCGDPITPDAPSATPIVKVATLVAIVENTSSQGSRRFLSAERCTIPAHLSSRLDEPPESSREA